MYESRTQAIVNLLRWAFMKMIQCYFPISKKGAMYKGMKPEKSYTLKELGIEYDE